MSILTAATTIYCGLLYLTGDMGEEIQLVLFALILLSNAVFFFTWLWAILEAYALLVMQKRPKIAKWICFCFVASRRFRKFAASMGINTQLFNVELSPEQFENSTFIECNELEGKKFTQTPINSMIDEDSMPESISKEALTDKGNDIVENLVEPTELEKDSK